MNKLRISKPSRLSKVSESPVNPEQLARANLLELSQTFDTHDSKLPAQVRSFCELLPEKQQKRRIITEIHKPIPEKTILKYFKRLSDDIESMGDLHKFSLVNEKDYRSKEYGYYLKMNQTLPINQYIIEGTEERDKKIQNLKPGKRLPFSRYIMNQQRNANKFRRQSLKNSVEVGLLKHPRYRSESESPMKIKAESHLSTIGFEERPKRRVLKLI